MLKHSEKRVHPRTEAGNLAAQICIKRPPDEKIDLMGTVADFSCSGIKIKLNSPLIAELNDKITIKIQLPKSGIPITIHGIIKNFQSESEYGLHFNDPLAQKTMDDLIFECVIP